MAPEIQTSFIPKQNMSASMARVSSQATLGLFMVVGMVIMALSLAVFAGAYGYQYLLSDSINRACVPGNDQGCGLRASLERDKRELQVERIVRFSRLDAKMKTAAGIINSHVTMMPLLDTLENLTLQTVRYTKLDFTDKGIAIEGMAIGYEDVAVQLKAFKESGKIKSAVFSGLGLDQRGNVTFKLALVVDPKLLSYVASQDQTAMVDESSAFPELPASLQAVIASSSRSGTGSSTNLTQ